MQGSSDCAVPATDDGASLFDQALARLREQLVSLSKRSLV